MKKGLFSYLPLVLQNVLEFRYLTLAEQPEFDRLLDIYDEVLNAQFVMTAGEKAISRYEEIFGVSSSAADTLEERRLRVLAKMLERLPYTIRRLREMLAALCGDAGYEIELYHDKYEIVIRLIEQSASVAESVRDMLIRVIPANLLQFFTLQAAEAKTAVHIAVASSCYSRFSLPVLEPDRAVRDTVNVYGASAINSKAILQELQPDRAVKANVDIGIAHSGEYSKAEIERLEE